MTMFTRRLLAILAFCLFPAVAQPAPAVPAPFERLVPTAFDDGLRLVEVQARGHDGPPWRMVEWQPSEPGLPPRRDKVSVRDGLRAMYAYPDSDYFANVKVETSAPGLYEQDRALVIAVLAHNFRHNRARMDARLAADPALRARVAARTAPGKEVTAFERETVNGIEVVSYTENALGNGGVIGMLHFFVPGRETIVTAYLLHQKRNRFKDIEEFLRLRAAFIQGWTAFLARSVAVSEGAGHHAGQ